MKTLLLGAVLLVTGWQGAQGQEYSDLQMKAPKPTSHPTVVAEAACPAGWAAVWGYNPLIDGPQVEHYYCKAVSPEPVKWHRATKAECGAEIRRELKVMAEYGFEGDPPITLGFGSYSLSTHTGKQMDPCGYADGKGNFKPRYTIIQGEKEAEVTEEEYNKFEPGLVIVRAEARGRVLYFHIESIAAAKKAYGDNLLGCVPEQDIRWSVVKELPKGEVYWNE